MYKLLDTNLGERDHISLSLAERDMPVFNKVANQRDFPAEVDEAIKSLKKKKGHSYLLLTAMGVGETWGANNNADYFPSGALLGKQNEPTKWDSVSYEPPKDERLDANLPPKQRFKTFEDAHFFHHHRNKIEKDPAFGSVKRAVWFPKMGTVLLLLEIDNKKDPESAEAIARGVPLAFSMGCKVPYDVCSICGNKASSLFQYCGHLRNEKNSILADGRRVAAINLHPRFFDISKVTRPAFLAGMQLQKVASQHRVVETLSSVELADYYDLASFDKRANDATGAVAGESSPIPKHLLEAVERVTVAEKDVPFSLVKVIVAKAGGDVSNVLGAFAYRGIILKPNEFAAIVLLAAGKDDLAEKAYHSRVVLDKNPKVPCSPETAELSTPATGHKAKELSEEVKETVAEDRSIVTVGDRFYDVSKNLLKIATLPPTSPMLGIGAVMSGLYMLYRDKIKEHPVLSSAIGAALGYALLKSSGQATNNFDNHPSLQQAYMLKSYV